MPTEGDVLDDLQISSYFKPLLLSEVEGVEKPSSEIFFRACNQAGVRPQETVHIGDDLHA